MLVPLLFLLTRVHVYGGFTKDDFSIAMRQKLGGGLGTRLGKHILQQLRTLVCVFQWALAHCCSLSIFQSLNGSFETNPKKHAAQQFSAPGPYQVSLVIQRNVLSWQAWWMYSTALLYLQSVSNAYWFREMSLSSMGSKVGFFEQDGLHYSEEHLHTQSLQLHDAMVLVLKIVMGLPWECFQI